MSVFGWCTGPINAVVNHDACPYEIGSSAGIVRCSCGCHNSPEKGVRLTTLMSEGHPRCNGDGPLTTNRSHATKGG